VTAKTRPVPLYRWTALGTAVVRMWRAWRVLIPVIIANAVIQSVLLLGQPRPYLTVPFVLLAVLSFLVFVLAFCAVASAVLQATTGPVEVAQVMARVRARALPLVGWTLAWALVVTLGFTLYVIPGLIVLALTPFLLIAVVDGQRNPLLVNFRVIGERWGRWLVTVVIVGVLLGVVWLLTNVDGFFVGGALGALIGWLVLGLITAWLTCGWALIYRSSTSAPVEPSRGD
jgi:hypothetical protein